MKLRWSLGEFKKKREGWYMLLMNAFSNIIRLSFFHGYRISWHIDIFWNRANLILGPRFAYGRAERPVEKGEINKRKRKKKVEFLTSRKNIKRSFLDFRTFRAV